MISPWPRQWHYNAYNFKYLLICAGDSEIYLQGPEEIEGHLQCFQVMYFAEPLIVVVPKNSSYLQHLTYYP